MLLLCVTPMALLLQVAVVHGATWGYTRSNGETQWLKNFPYCGGAVQSPVDFKTEKLVFDPTLLPIGVHNYALPANEELVLGNNGHTLLLSLPSTMYISKLPQRYSAAQLHLHWGSVTKPLGSEHTVNSKQYAAELHIVHFNSEKYTDVAMAFDKSDGLAVLGIFIKIGEFNPAYDKFIKHLSKISNKGTKTKIPAFNIRKLMPTRLDEYYRYDGSLTAPPCYASVLWTVFKNHVTISKEQYKTLTTALFASGAKQNTPVPLIGNFRNPLPAEHRVVLTSFKAAAQTWMNSENKHPNLRFDSLERPRLCEQQEQAVLENTPEDAFDLPLSSTTPGVELLQIGLSL
ncbi:carbonic anhydrase 12 [Nerophis lumbriciformis]|uniref:carbonic anhydrase 12 n=1 Tax=Nerophis lumbriciformis TaxID=546530 RepID=UPI003BA8D95F